MDKKEFFKEIDFITFYLNSKFILGFIENSDIFTIKNIDLSTWSSSK